MKELSRDRACLSSGQHRHLINILPSGQLNGALPQRRLISQLARQQPALTPSLLAANLCEDFRAPLVRLFLGS